MGLVPAEAGLDHAPGPPGATGARPRTRPFAAPTPALGPGLAPGTGIETLRQLLSSRRLKTRASSVHHL